MVNRSEESVVKRRSYSKQYSAELREERIAKGLCYICGENKAQQTNKICEHCATKRNDRCKNVRARLKAEAFDGYSGPICNCCGFSEHIDFMQMDHIDGSGHKHLQPNGKRYKGETLYRWLIENNFPEGFQVLCANCNFFKSNNKQCHHKTKEYQESLKANSAGTLSLCM
jgi:hypothetical protein